MKEKQIVVSGIRPTGQLHLGNYLGAIKDFVRLQDECECFFFVADYHSLTTLNDFSSIAKYTREIVITFLSAGLDPNKCAIFVQSAIPEIPEIALLLSRFQPGKSLLSLPTYTEKVSKDPKSENASLLYYPILMAADILAHRATLIPVGSDQEINIRTARDIARRFNNMLGNVFPMPKTLERETIKVPGLGISGKMGKSEDEKNNINLTDSKDIVTKKILLAMTDTQRKRRTDPGNPFNCNIYALHELISPETMIEEVQQGCRSAKIGCVDCKKCLIKLLWREILEPIQKKRAEILKKPSIIDNAIHYGNLKARKSAQKTLEILRTKMGLT